MSTAVSTDIPTSELISEGLSFIPSPMYPTILSDSFNNLTILAFCIGESFTKILVSLKVLTTATSDSLSNLFPDIILFEFIYV